MRGSCVFCCLSYISLNPKSHLNNYFMFIAKEKLGLCLSVVLLLLSESGLSPESWFAIFYPRASCIKLVAYKKN